MTTTAFGDRLAGRLAPWLTDDLGTYAQAIGTMFDPLEQIVADVGMDGDPDYMPGYGVLLDIETCPTEDLGYLGQYVGVPVPVGVDDATARSLIRAEGGIGRGTLASVRAAILRHLTGTQSLVIFERTALDGSPDAYQAVVHLRPSEVADLQTIKDAVNAVKPAGILINYIVSDGYTWAEAIHAWADDTFMWGQALSTQP